MNYKERLKNNKLHVMELFIANPDKFFKNMEIAQALSIQIKPLKRALDALLAEGKIAKDANSRTDKYIFNNVENQKENGVIYRATGLYKLSPRMIEIQNELISNRLRYPSKQV